MLRIVKLGGSLLDLPGVGERLQAWLAGQPAAVTLLVAGGGTLAEAVRDSQQVHGFDDPAAHRLALDAMGITAALMHELLPSSTLVRRPDQIDLAADYLQVVDVREFLAVPVTPAADCSQSARCAEEPESEMVLRSELVLRDAEPLPESWQVTSDSIAVHLAHRLGADEVVLLKSTLPRLDPASAEAWADEGLVDGFFPRAAAAFLSAGRHLAVARTIRLVNLRDAHLAEVELLESP